LLDGVAMFLVSRRLLAFVFVCASIAVLSLPGCSAIGGCGDCDPKTEYCTAQGSQLNHCAPGNYQCEPLPAACVHAPSCACLTASPPPPFTNVSCTGNAAAGFTVELDPNDC